MNDRCPGCRCKGTDGCLIGILVFLIFLQGCYVTTTVEKIERILTQQQATHEK